MPRSVEEVCVEVRPRVCNAGEAGAPPPPPPPPFFGQQYRFRIRACRRRRRATDVSASSTPVGAPAPIKTDVGHALTRCPAATMLRRWPRTPDHPPAARCISRRTLSEWTLILCRRNCSAPTAPRAPSWQAPGPASAACRRARRPGGTLSARVCRQTTVERAPPITMADRIHVLIAFQLRAEPTAHSDERVRCRRRPGSPTSPPS